MFSYNKSLGYIYRTTLCKLCDQEEEDVDHLFFRCGFVKQFWGWFCNWSNFQLPADLTFVSLENHGESLRNCKKVQKLYWALVYDALWSIWMARNDSIFKNKRANPMKTAEEMQLNSYNWLKNRGNCSNLNWYEWCNSPFHFCTM